MAARPGSGRAHFAWRTPVLMWAPGPVASPNRPGTWCQTRARRDRTQVRGYPGQGQGSGAVRHRGRWPAWNQAGPDLVHRTGARPGPAVRVKVPPAPRH